MSWGDAKHLSVVTSIAPVDGRGHLLKVIRDVLDAEQEPLAEDALADPRPRRAKLTSDGAYDVPPSWRYRVQEIPFTYDGMLRVNSQAVATAVPEREIAARIARCTEAGRESMSQVTPEVQVEVGAWKIAGYDIVQGSRKKRRVKVAIDSGAAQGKWEHQWRGDIMAGKEVPAAKPSKVTTVLREDEGFVLRVVWFDAARMDEPNVGVLRSYHASGHYPNVLQREREVAFTILKARLAGLGKGTLADIPRDKVEAVEAMLEAGTLPRPTIATLVGLREESVDRIAASLVQPAPKAREFGPGRSNATKVKAAKADPAPKASEPAPPIPVKTVTKAEE